MDSLEPRLGVPAAGLLHLGVGLYGALRIQEVGRVLGHMTADGQRSFQLLEETLAVLASKIQGPLGEEYETRLSKLRLLYEHLAEHVVQGHDASVDDIERLVGATYDLEAWLPIKLRAWSPGSPERFPFFAARVFGLRCRMDALALRPGVALEDRATVSLHGELGREARALCEGQGLHALAFSRASAIAGLALLRRGLRSPGPGSIQKDENGIERLVYGREDLVWEDGLDELRGLLSPGSVAAPTATIALRHLDDYEWLVRWADLDRTSFDVHSVSDLPVASLLGSFGHPTPYPPLSDATVSALRPLALPDFRTDIAHRLQEEFGWSDPLTIPAEIRLQSLTTTPRASEEIPFIGDPLLAQLVGPLLVKIPGGHRGSVARFWSKQRFDFSFGWWEVSIIREGDRFHALLGSKNLSTVKYDVFPGEAGPPICLYTLERQRGGDYHSSMPRQMKVLLLEGTHPIVESDGNTNNILRML